MKIIFNSLGIVTDFQVESTDSLRQGTVGNRLVAIFEDLSISDYVPTLNFTRSDGSKVTDVGMNITNDNECEVKFDDPWYFALDGDATMTVFLHDGLGNVIAQGQHRITIESTDYDPTDVPPITEGQYLYLLDQIAKRIAKDGTTTLGTWMTWQDTDHHYIFSYSKKDSKFNFYIPVAFTSIDAETMKKGGKNVATEEYVSNAVSGLASESYVDSAVAGLASEAYVTEQLENYVTNSALETTLNDYATKNYVTTEITSGLAPYATRDYVNIQIAAAVSNTYKWSGSKTVAELNALTVTSLMHGNVYNVTSDGILNQGNVSVIAGDNVAIIWDAQNNTYLWDKLAGTFTVDLSGYLQKSSAFNSVYATTSNGSQIMIGYSESASGSGGYFVLRKSNGQISVPETPIADGDATSKKYVDEHLAEKQDLLTFMNLTTDIDYVMEDE